MHIDYKTIYHRQHSVLPRRSHKQFATQHKFLARAMPCGWQSANSLFSTISGRMRAINSAPRFAVSGALPFTQATYISESIVARNSPGTRNSLLMSWRFLRPFHRYFPILQDRFWFWHDIQLARGCNHLAGPTCVKEGSWQTARIRFTHVYTHVCARSLLPSRLSIGYSMRLFE